MRGCVHAGKNVERLSCGFEDILDFSIFDSLWVRKFEVEITVDIDLAV